MENDEVRRDAFVFEGGKKRRRPTIGLEPIILGHRDADFNGGIGGFHLSEVIAGAAGVGERVMRRDVVVAFPIAIVFVADFPVFEIAVVGDIGATDQHGSLLRRPGAVIHRDNHLSLQVGGDVYEIREGGRPPCRVGRTGVGGPMISIGNGAAGEPQRQRGGFA